MVTVLGPMFPGCLVVRPSTIGGSARSVTAVEIPSQFDASAVEAQVSDTVARVQWFHDAAADLLVRADALEYGDGVTAERVAAARRSLLDAAARLDEMDPAGAIHLPCTQKQLAAIAWAHGERLEDIGPRRAAFEAWWAGQIERRWGVAG